MLWLYKLWKIACRFSSQTLWIYFDPLFTISTKIIKRSRSSICAPPPSCLAHTHAHANTHLEGVERERERELREKWSRRALPSTKTRQTTRPLSRPPNPTPPSLPLSLSLLYRPLNELFLPGPVSFSGGRVRLSGAVRGGGPCLYGTKCQY